MITLQEQDRKNKQVAMVATVGINLLVLLLLFLIVGWRAPNPPAPEYGMEVNFGTDDQGWGEEQPKERVGTPKGSKEETEPVQKPQEEPKDEPQQETETKPSEPKVTDNTPKDPLTSDDEESDVAAKTKKDDKKEEAKKPAKEEPKTESKPQTEQQTQKVDNKSVYKPKTGSSNSNAGEGREGAAGNHGDDPGTVGDKGNPNGSLDAKSLYGKPGGGGGGNGFGLNMAGWGWADTPKFPNVPDNQSGRIVFEIEVDEQGEIINIKTLEKTLSAEAERMCRQEIQRLSLVRTSAGSTPERSKGKVVFNLTVR